MSVSRRFLGLIVLSVQLSFCACSGAPDGRKESAVNGQYFLVSVNIQIPYWQMVGAGFTKAASELQVNANLVGPDTYDPKAEQQEFRRVVQLRPAGILVSPADPDLMKSDIDAAIASGIPVITVDADSPRSKRLSFIGTDNREAGRMLGEFIGSLLRGAGSIVIFTMPGQENLDERFRGYMEILSGYPHTMQRVVDIKGDPRVAFDEAEKILKKPGSKVDAFACLEALACKEVAKALSNGGVRGKTVIAMDADPETLDWIRKGLIQGTIAQRPFTMGVIGLKMLEDLHRHRPGSLDVAWSKDPLSPIPSFVNTGVIWVDKQNVDAFIQAQEPRKRPGD
ncbi:MAG TPA: substrate-binding domain-containing protein [Candidatus Acidoferrum sp.]|nr:substrate-binding domain-containing protein [Candidatus Acidoferrum sp.]